MRCRVCGNDTELLLEIPNQPASVSDFTGNDKPITLRVTKCVSCGLVQLDNAPVKEWWKQTRSGYTEDVKAASSGYDTCLLHSLEHSPSPNNELRQIHGRALITVPNYDGRITEYCIDHLTYFTPDTLRFALTRTGLVVTWLDIIDDGETIAAGVERSDYAVWGAGHQAQSAVSIYGMNPQYIIDSNPKKQGGVLPVTHFRIYPPEAFFALPTKKLVVMAGGYNAEVIRLVKEKVGDDYPIYVLTRGWPYGLVREGSAEARTA